jgi:hypothetical protein
MEMAAVRAVLRLIIYCGWAASKSSVPFTTLLFRTADHLPAVLDVIHRARHPRLPRTACTAKVIVIRLDAMTNDFASAIRADRREFVYRAFETIERVPVAGRYNFKRQIIIVTAYFAARHKTSPYP